MAARDIICFFETQDDNLTPAAKQALAFAIAHQSHLTSIAIARLLSVPGVTFGGGVAAGLLSNANSRVREAAERVAKLAHDAAKLAGVKHESAVHAGTLADTSAWIAQRARTAGFSIVDRPVDVIDAQQAYFEDALFQSGRPVMIASPMHISEQFRRISIAWDGSRVAARAMGDALAVLPHVEEADLVVVAGEKELANAVPGADAALHLSRCGIKSNLVNVELGKRSVAEAINEAAGNRNADVIVMGGFGHSRLREFILGGVTRELSASATRPLLLSH